MKPTRFALCVGLFSGSLVASGDALACGDKVMVAGRGNRPGQARMGPRASILVYADPAGSMPKALNQGHLRQGLERAGHRVRSVGTRDELSVALKTGTYDLLLTDLKAAPSVETEARQASSKPTVVPTLFNPTETELAEAQGYPSLVRAPGSEKDYLAVVDDALAVRGKQSQAERKGK